MMLDPIQKRHNAYYDLINNCKNDHVDKIVEISREVKQLAIQINDLKADMRVFINEQKLDTSNNAQDNKEIKDMLKTVFAYIHKSTGSAGSLEGYIGVGSSS